MENYTYDVANHLALLHPESLQELNSRHNMFEGIPNGPVKSIAPLLELNNSIRIDFYLLFGL